MEFFDTIVTEEAKQRVMGCLNSGHLSEGELVQEFEQSIEHEFGYKYGVAVNSGTSALHLALLMCGVKQGCEVIIPAQTFVATGLAVLYCGAKIVFADIDIVTGNISVEDVRRKITDKTRAIICVAWGGNLPDLQSLHDLTKDIDIYLIQDNAQALGATYHGTLPNAYGDFSCFSFQATKHLTTGDGGMIVSRPLYYPSLKKSRWFGIDREKALPDGTGERNYNLTLVDYKYHMNDYSAALGLGNIVGIHERIEKRRAIANYYDKHLERGIPLVSRDVGSSNWIYTFSVERRNDFIGVMKRRGIPTSVVHVGIDRNDVFGGLQDLPNQRYWDEHHVCLPCHSSLTGDDVKKIVEAVNLGW